MRELQVLGETDEWSQIQSPADVFGAQIVLCTITESDGEMAEIVGHLVCVLAGAKLIVVDEDPGSARQKAAIDAGAAAYLSKRTPLETFCQCVVQIVSGEGISAKTSREAINGKVTHSLPSMFQNLTPRELEVLRHLAAGKSVRQTAEVMQLAPSTVDNHKTRMMRKLNVHKTVELVRLVLRSDGNS